MALTKLKLNWQQHSLETHRYAALKGGSMAFTKMEGTTVNIKDKVNTLLWRIFKALWCKVKLAGSLHITSNSVKLLKLAALWRMT